MQHQSPQGGQCSADVNMLMLRGLLNTLDSVAAAKGCILFVYVLTLPARGYSQTSFNPYPLSHSSKLWVMREYELSGYY